jgi:hypothetical protein
MAATPYAFATKSFISFTFGIPVACDMSCSLIFPHCGTSISIGTSPLHSSTGPAIPRTMASGKSFVSFIACKRSFIRFVESFVYLFQVCNILKSFLPRISMKESLMCVPPKSPAKIILFLIPSIIVVYNLIINGVFQTKYYIFR